MQLNNIYKITESGQAVRLGSYYYEAIVPTKNELFDKISEDFDRYAELNLYALPIINKNQVNKYLREKKSFFIKATRQAWNDAESVNSWDSKIDLYLSPDDIIQEATTETPHENKKGCTEYEKKTRFTLKKDIFLASGYELRLYKDFEKIPDHEKRLAKGLEANYKENREFWLNKGKADTIRQYEKKLREGFTCYVCGKSARVPVCEFVAGFGYVRAEKSPEYKRAEKLRDIINTCVYDNNKISIYETLHILEKLNITAKRTKADK